MTLVRAVAWTAAIAANAAILAGLRLAPLLQHAFQAEQLPEPYVRHSIEFYPWPLGQVLEPTLTGLTEREVQAFFNDPYQLPASPGPRRCLEFRRDWDPAVTVSFLAGRAEAVWVSPAVVPPKACPTLIHRAMPVP